MKDRSGKFYTMDYSMDKNLRSHQLIIPLIIKITTDNWLNLIQDIKIETKRT